MLFSRRSARAGAIVVFVVAGVATPTLAVVTSSSSGSGVVHVNTHVGADRWYGAGYTGSRATAAIVEGGAVWNGHDTLGHVARYVSGPSVPGANPSFFPPSTPNFDFHATYTGHVLAGRAGGDTSDPPLQRGIAYGATLWSGAIAVSMNGLSFSTTFNSVVDTYQAMLVDGPPTQHADVINSSWGRSGFINGESARVRALDAMAYQSGAVLVSAAGNTGPLGSSVIDPAIMKNDLTVGALDTVPGEPAFASVASLSARGPQGFALPTSASTWTIISGVRAPVDLVAPGMDFTLAAYVGASGGNASLPDNDLSPGGYAAGVSGTSFAAPVVSGGAALIVDAARDRGLDRLRDGRTVRAVLMTSATKLAGWDSGLTEDAGVWRTTQGVDYAQGAGALNLDRAFDVALSGDTDLPGLAGGSIQARGWDFAQAALGAPVDYAFTASLLAGDVLTATLSWFAADRYNTAFRSEDLALWGTQADLNLQLWRTATDVGGPSTLIAESASMYNLNEHLTFTLPSAGDYFLRVVFAGETYDFQNRAPSESFALAWDLTSVPTPGAMALPLMAGLACAAPRRRRPCPR